MTPKHIDTDSILDEIDSIKDDLFELRSRARLLCVSARNHDIESEHLMRLDNQLNVTINVAWSAGFELIDAMRIMTDE